MADFYLVEDVPVGLASLLTAAGHPTRTTVAERRLREWDASQLLYAAEHRWTIITHNQRDFRALHEGWRYWSPQWRIPRPHSGILTLDKGNRRLEVADIARAILGLLADPSLSLMNRCLE